MTDVEIEIQERGDDVRITIRGEIDLSNADRVEARLTGAVSNRTSEVMIDLGEVTYLDSAGLRMVFSVMSRLRPLQIVLRIVAPVGSPARRVIDLSGMASIAPVEPAP